jgi:hypothetical protein
MHLLLLLRLRRLLLLGSPVRMTDISQRLQPQLQINIAPTALGCLPTNSGGWHGIAYAACWLRKA